MKKLLLFSAFLFFTDFLYAQTAPPVEWIEAVSGTYSGNYSAIRTPNFLYVLKNESNRFSNFVDLEKYDGNTKIWSKRIKSCTTQSLGACNNPSYYFLSASQTDGVLLKKDGGVRENQSFEYYNSDGNLVWSKPENAVEASATLDGGFYVRKQETFISPPNYPYHKLQRFSENGNLIFEVDLGVGNIVNNIQTTSDNAVVVLSTTDLRKYNFDGSLAYTLPIVANQIISIDASTFGVYDNQRFYKMRIVDGSIQLLFQLPNLKDVDVLNGNIFLTDNNTTYKLNSSGSIIWNQSNFGGESLKVMDNGSVSIMKLNVLTKLNSNGNLLWQKTFHSQFTSSPANYRMSVQKSSDEGLYIEARYPTYILGYQPVGFLMKIGADNGTCNYNVSTFTNCDSPFQLRLRYNGGFVPDPFGNIQRVATDFSFQWKKDGIDISGATNDNYQPSQDGSYSVVIKNGSCEVASSPYLFLNPNLSGTLTSNTNLTGISIHSTQKIENPAKVNYQAGKSVILQSGFEARANAVFEARIVSCN